MDISLEDYIACKPKYAQFIPHSQGRWQKKRFRKAQCPIVERMVCSMMRHGRNNGKKVMALRIIKHAFEIIHLLTEQNPVQVYVEAVINCAHVRTRRVWVVAALFVVKCATCRPSAVSTPRSTLSRRVH